MKNGIINLFGMAILAVLCGCGRHLDVTVVFKNRIIAAALNAKASKLYPENGGWRFDGENRTQIYVVYGTKPDALRGTVKYVWVSEPGAVYAKRRDFYAAYFANEKKTVCPEALKLARQTGEAALKKTLFGRVKCGVYPMAMARPCGQMEIRIFPARTKPKK